LGELLLAAELFKQLVSCPLNSLNKC
jgi:hypothetical protein